MSEISFNIEYSAARLLYGWAHDPAEGAGLVDVVVPLTTGELTITAGNYREDLRDAGFGDGHAGFVVQLRSTQCIDPTKPLRFRSRLHETEHVLPPGVRKAVAFDGGLGCFLADPVPLFECALVLIIKDETHYLEEWIEYHRALGVDHFVIFDNGSTDGLRDFLDYYLKLGIVTLIDWPNLERATPDQRRYAWLEQDTAYACAVRLLANRAAWVGFLDVDEFFVFEGGRHGRIGPFLDGFSSPMVNLYWRLFGTSDLEDRPDGLVIENFIHRAADADARLCKVFVRPGHVHTIANAHHFTVGAERLHGFNTAGAAAFGGEPLLAAYEGAVIHHYHTRSRREFRDKVRRGWPVNHDDKNVNWEQHFHDHDTNEVWDPIAADFKAAVEGRIHRSRRARRSSADPLHADVNWLLRLPLTLLLHVEVVWEEDELVLEGHALDLAAPNSVFELAVHDGYGTQFGRVECSLASEILLMNRVSHGAHGFRFVLPAVAHDSGWVVVSNPGFVRVVCTSVA